MQEVLRRLYQDHRSSLQQERIKKVLQNKQSYSPTRNRYQFREESRQKTPQTANSFDQDIRFEKDFQRICRFNLPQLEAKFIKKKTPQQISQEKKQNLKKKLKAAVISVLFVQRLNKLLRCSLLRRKRKAQKYSQNFVLHIEQLIHHYYQKILKEEFLEYCSILQKHLQNPHLDQNKQIMTLLYYLTGKLATSSLTKQLTGFFVYTSTERSFPPSDFLSLAEINRLDFSPQYGCLMNVSDEQLRMIVGLGVGVKIFCFYILYKPWNLDCAPQQLSFNKEKLANIVKDVGSILYYTLMEEFCLNVEEVKTLNKSLINSFGVRAIRQLDPLEEGQTGSTSKGLICNQNRHYLNSMTAKHPNLIANIRKNVYKWISRISYACWKESQKISQPGNPRSIFHQAKESSQTRGSPDRLRFRSIELKNKKKELEKSKKNKYQEFPQLKATIV